MRGIIQDTKTGETKEIEDGLPIPPSAPPVYYYELVKQVVVSGIGTLDLDCTVVAISRSLSTAEEAALETGTSKKIRKKWVG